MLLNKILKAVQYYKNKALNEAEESSKEKIEFTYNLLIKDLTEVKSEDQLIDVIAQRMSHSVLMTILQANQVLEKITGDVEVFVGKIEEMPEFIQEILKEMLKPDKKNTPS